MSTITRDEKNKIVQEMLTTAPIFTKKFEEKMPVSVKKFAKLVPLMPNALFDQLYAVLLLENKRK
jgi:menaquinone-dependent protoporphyrinogen IX oxidase